MNIGLKGGGGGGDLREGGRNPRGSGSQQFKPGLRAKLEGRG